MSDFEGNPNWIHPEGDLPYSLSEYKGIKPGDCVLRKPNASTVGEAFSCHPFSFGQVTMHQIETISTRPEVLHDMLHHEIDEYKNGIWVEMVMTPFSPKMAHNRVTNAWVREEFWKIPKPLYVLLCALWPLLYLLYPRKLNGQRTDFKSLFRFGEQRGPWWGRY